MYLPDQHPFEVLPHQNCPARISRPQFFSALLILGAAFSSLITVPQASGATITWAASPVNIDINDVSQVLTVGTLFAAVDSTSQFTGLSYTVNNVVFTSSTANLGIVANAAGAYGTAPDPQTTYSPLVNGVAYLNSAQSAAYPSYINNLTPGQTYLMQIFEGYSNGTIPVTRFSSSAPTLDLLGPGTGYNAPDQSSDVLAGLNTGDPGTTIAPQYITGTFVADPSGSQNFYYYGSNYGLIASIQVRAVPEPQTWALAALGASAVLFRLRRQQRAS